MADLVTYNGRQALLRTVEELLANGEWIAPRGLRTKELRGFEVMIENPYDALMPGINANFSSRVVASEALQLIAGVSDPEFTMRMVPRMRDYYNVYQRRFDGAYGPPTRTQLEIAVRRLEADPDTRQAVVAVWNESHAQMHESLDYPCTTTLQFLIRHGRLELDVTMRSNDVAMGFKHDVGQFTQLQLTIANVLGYEAGPYRHRVGSMHLYETNFKWAENLDPDGARTPIPDHPEGISSGIHINVPPGGAFYAARRRALSIMHGEELPLPTESERWYRQQVANSWATLD